MSELNQSEPKYKYSEFVRIPLSLKKRLNKIRKDTGKSQNLVTEQIIKLGIDAYYTPKQNTNQNQTVEAA